MLRIEGFRFYFYSNEGAEPAHVHVDRDQDGAKFLAESGFVGLGQRV